MKKLSDDLRKLADRAASAEDKVKAAEQESKDKLDASIRQSKAEAKARQDAFKAQVKARQAASAQQWVDLQTSYNQKVQQIKSKIEVDKEVHEAKRARRSADRLAADARDLILFAMLAIDDAELALLEAIEADAYADSLADQLEQKSIV
jgi:hypothetical protein